LVLGAREKVVWVWVVVKKHIVRFTNKFYLCNKNIKSQNRRFLNFDLQQLRQTKSIIKINFLTLIL